MDVKYQNCTDSYFNSVILPEVTKLNEPTIANRIIDRATGINSWLNQVAVESCEGNLTSKSGNLLAKAVVKTGLNTVTTFGTGALVFVGLAAGSPILVAGSLATGAITAFGVVPWISDVIVNNTIELIDRTMNRTKEYFN